MKTYAQKMIKYIPLTLLVVYLCGCTATMVTISRIEPPVYDIPPGKKLAVLDFVSYSDYPESGRALASTLIAKLMPTGYYDIIERTQIQNVIRELKFATTDYVDPNNAKRIGRLVGADYVIVGEVTAYDVEDDVQHKQVTDRVWTGGYYYDRRGRRHREYRSVLRTVEVRIRRGTVSATFRLVDVETGKIIASDQQSRTFRKSTEAFLTSGELPAKDYILTKLTEEVVDAFARKIAPHRVFERRRLEYGKHPLIRRGVAQANNGLWREAFETWNTARQYAPDDPAIYNNMGVAAELKGDYDAAEKFYKKALELRPEKSQYMQNINRVRRLKKIYEKRIGSDVNE